MKIKNHIAILSHQLWRQFESLDPFPQIAQGLLGMLVAMYLSAICFAVQDQSGDASPILSQQEGSQKLPQVAFGQQAPLVPIPTNAEAWAMLPKVVSGQQTSLPIWARAVAVQLPRTAAAMLQLDAAHRMHSPLSPQLRAKLRWGIARANHCSYSEIYALADLRRAGADEASALALTVDSSTLPVEEQDALAFVEMLTVAATTIPDTLFQRLVEQYGEREVAAMVLLAAYGNFQDRIILGLNLPLEENGPLAPLNVEFEDGALQMASLIPPNDGEARYVENGRAVVPSDTEWMSVTYDQLQRRLENQRDRMPRLPIPQWEEVRSKLPAAMSTNPTSIRWSLINYGYAHELAIPWTIATRTHWSEAPAERILEESLFWVQTRAIECNYCMGHCEMLLEVAGLDKSEIAERTRLLAESNWSRFPPSEQRAYGFARKLSRTPWEMTAEDYQALTGDFGEKQGMAIFWWLCRGLYMTRISDGFQLPLERDNVFDNHGPTTEPK